jgi:phosphatidylinositol alpha-1,6-mannosyltransferase
METLALGVWRALHGVQPHARRLSLGRRNANLAWWFPWTALRLGGLLVRGRVDRVLVGDALTYAVLSPLIRVFHVPAVLIVNGLDVTYRNPLYRAVVVPTLRCAPTVLAISAATAEAVAAVGVPRDRLSVLPLGLATPAVSSADRELARQQVTERLSLGPDATILLTLGRLVRRKGAAWFVSEVLPRLPATAHYVLAGAGPDEEHVLTAADSAGVRSRVHLLGLVDEALREQLLRGADVFVQPNIAVPGDMEGFGLVTIEAALRGTPVVAADLEGIRDAVVSDVTGLLLASGDARAWAELLAGLLNEPAELVTLGARFAEQAKERYGEAAMATVLTQALSSARG